MLPNAASSPVLQRHPTPPSSPDPIHIKPVHTPDMAKRPAGSSSDPKSHPPKRQKRDTNSNSDSPDGPSETKNEDEALMSKFASLVHQAAKGAWEQLAAAQRHLTEFPQKDIINVAVQKLSQLQQTETSVSTLKKELAKYFRKTAMFRRSTRPDAPPDSFVMANPSFIAHPAKSTRVREPLRKADGKKGTDQVTPDGEDEVMFQGVVVQPEQTIPDEWLQEAYKPVRLSTFDKSRAISFVDDEKTNRVKGFKGYRSIRATSGVLDGDWYYECRIMPSKKGHCRLGWTTRRSDTEAPVGFDAYGFGIRDVTGDFVNRGRTKRYGKPFGPGDVIGCRIIIPQLTEEQRKAVHDAEKRWLDFRFLSFGQGQPPRDSGIDLSPHGRVEFFKNGVSMGIPEFFTKPQPVPVRKTPRRGDESTYHGKFREPQNGLREVLLDDKRVMKGAVYYPSISLFEDAEVDVNFGPHFEFQPPTESKPMCDAAREAPPPAPAGTQSKDAGGKPEEGSNEISAEAKGMVGEQVTNKTDGSRPGSDVAGITAPIGAANHITTHAEQRPVEMARKAPCAPNEVTVISPEGKKVAVEYLPIGGRHSSAASSSRPCVQSPKVFASKDPTEK
eukprot:GFKZ01007341.1.p1 GENE.GFKZ01007341.1~~GFKZ01007341.1.p1  ORF type:complete len:706 (+),score=77.57 GFKZ01007341.1:280-2118(+)